jgi:hypothetical protein
LGETSSMDRGDTYKRKRSLSVEDDIVQWTG